MPAFGDPGQILARLHRITSGEFETGTPAAEPKESSRAFTVRVDTTQLDYPMDMVGEMVIALSLIRHNPALVSVRDSRLQGDLAQLVRIAGEVQRTTMGMRMVLVGQLFQRTARLVRDLSRKAGKTSRPGDQPPTIAQDEASCVVFGMPKEAIRLGGGSNPAARPDRLGRDRRIGPVTTATR